MLQQKALGFEWRSCYTCAATSLANGISQILRDPGGDNNKKEPQTTPSPQPHSVTYSEMQNRMNLSECDVSPSKVLNQSSVVTLDALTVCPSSLFLPLCSCFPPPEVLWLESRVRLRFPRGRWIGRSLSHRPHYKPVKQ